MSQQPFIVFACSACGEKIFAERSQLGERGRCPLCNAKTVIGGATPSSSKQRAAERRGARRVPIGNARVTLESKTGEGRTFNPDDMPVLDDISETGIGFKVKGEVDRKKLGGYGPPPWLKVGDTVSVTLHIPQLFRPRSVKAVVRRVVPVPNRKELFKVGCEFSQADEQVLRDLRKLLESK